MEDNRSLSSAPVEFRWRGFTFRPFDILTIAYLGIWILLIILYWSHIPYPDFMLTGHLALLLFIFLWAKFPPRLAPMKVIRDVYLLFYLMLFFTALHYLVPAIHPVNFDLKLAGLDFRLFGVHPTVWMEKLYNPWLTEYLQWSYLAFYFLPPIIAFILLAQERRFEFDRMATAIILAFYLSYFGYLLCPALGPRFFLAHLHTQPLTGAKYFQTIQQHLNALENIQWDAFPSGHVAIILITLFYIYRFLRRLFWWSVIIGISLILSTVYLRYHYVVDILAGIALGALAIGISEMWLKKRRNLNHQGKDHPAISEREIVTTPAESPD